MTTPSTIRTGVSADEIKQAFLDNLRCGLGRTERVATKHDLYVALALTARDRIFQRSVETIKNYGGRDARRVAYLSAEYLRELHDKIVSRDIAVRYKVRQSRTLKELSLYCFSNPLHPGQLVRVLNALAIRSSQPERAICRGVTELPRWRKRRARPWESGARG